MIHITINKAQINPDALHADLRAALGETCSGLSFGRGGVTVHLADEATRQQQAQAEAIVEAHDPAALTPGQQAEQARDASPLFALSVAEVEAWADSQPEADFRRELVRAVVHLRRLVRGA